MPVAMRPGPCVVACLPRPCVPNMLCLRASTHTYPCSYGIQIDGEPYISAGTYDDLAMMDTLKRLGCSFGPRGGAKLFAKAVAFR